jgi:hypothetical protein
VKGHEKNLLKTIELLSLAIYFVKEEFVPLLVVVYRRSASESYVFFRVKSKILDVPEIRFHWLLDTVYSIKKFGHLRPRLKQR